MVHLFAEAATSGAPAIAKGIMLGVSLAGAALGLGMLGSSYMNALGRNPEAGKAANQLIIIAAMIEVTALLAFLLGAFLLK